MKVRLLTLATVVAMLASAAGAPAQTGLRHPTDPLAVYLGTFTNTITLSVSSTGSKKGDTKKGDKTNIVNNVFVWRTSTGNTDYGVDVSSIRVASGDGTALDGVSTLQLFDMIAQSAVSTGISLGFALCHPVCTDAANSSVFSSACVTRTGSGLSTRFTPLDGSGNCVRSFSVCCPVGPATPSIRLLSSDSPGCAAVGGQSSCAPAVTPAPGVKIQ